MFFPIWRVDGRVIDSMKNAAEYAMKRAGETSGVVEVEIRHTLTDSWHHFVTVNGEVELDDE